ncbi:MAG TPA: adenylate/guanylate cyclase domain-containing protein [Chthoniobacterales bacterium]|jgi:TolB-like protein/class 3 adenylate cyclase/Tfp pilus assembly protein PilF|nr:adenylate/guanylate cyclase domain-containing protein [Chthoniobacterales bacterium]
MSTELESDLQLEIAHVLFIDVVGYSKLLINEQHERLGELNQVVRNTDAFRSAESVGKLIRLPTGDGMALAFSTSPDAPVRCALQIARALQSNPGLKVRMGVHSGPVSGMTDVNDRSNVTGAGINVAQRVMDCGDAGHILVSQRVAEDLAQYGHWQPFLHDLGRCEVKHGEVIALTNVYTDEVGNPVPPAKLRCAVDTRGNGRGPALIAGRGRRALVVLALVILVLAVTSWFKFHRALVQPTETAVASSSASAPAVTEKSIAVLPFENLSANQETGFFTDGVHDQILSNLSKVADLKVISRTSVMQYKVVRARNLREIGQQLGVAHVVEGSVQQSASRIRVTAQLIDARTDAHLWAQTYDREVADVFAIQSEIAATIADQLKVQLSPKEKAALAQPTTTDLLAQRLFVQAWQLIVLASNPDAKDGLLQAIPLLEEALTRDPKFLRAYGLLATAHLDLYWQGFEHTPERLEMARAVIDRAVKVNPDAGEVHMAQADYVYKAFRDYDRARAELDLARSTLPNNPIIYIYTAAIDRRQGRWIESIRNWEHGVALDPRNFRYAIETAFTYQGMRRYSESAAMFEHALSILPRDQFARTQLAQIPFFERADLEPLRACLAAILDDNPKAATEIANDLFYSSLAARDRAGVIRALQSIRAEGLRDLYYNSLWPRDWFVGLAARTFGDDARAQSAFASARVIEEKNVREQPTYAPAWSRLGLIDAGLGRKEEAIREGRRAVELLPIAKDSLDGPSYVTNLAMIYAWTGEKDLALEQLEVSARIPGGVTYGELKLHPQWDALRGDPRFEKLVASLAPPLAVAPTN